MTKDPSAYGDAASQPHVKVALRMRQRGLTAAAGETIPYVICQSQSGTSTSMADCAYHPDELKRDPTLRIDTAWYLQTQLHPPIVRLCEHIEGTDPAAMANCLGLDASKYRAASGSSSSGGSGDSLVRFMTQLTDEERFADCEKLQVPCSGCKESVEFSGIFKGKPVLIEY